jgi:excisionase family DNA binding protein
MTDHDILGIGEAAQLAGMHVKTFRRWSDSGRIPCVRTGAARGSRLFNRADVLAFVASRQRGSAQLVMGGIGDGERG